MDRPVIQALILCAAAAQTVLLNFPEIVSTGVRLLGFIMAVAVLIVRIFRIALTDPPAPDNPNDEVRSRRILVHMLEMIFFLVILGGYTGPLFLAIVAVGIIMEDMAVIVVALEAQGRL